MNIYYQAIRFYSPNKMCVVHKCPSTMVLLLEEPQDNL